MSFPHEKVTKEDSLLIFHLLVNVEIKTHSSIEGKASARCWFDSRRLMVVVVVVVCPQYEVKAPMPSACFRNVCKQMAKMHEAISDLLPEEQTQVRLRSLTRFDVVARRVSGALTQMCVSPHRCCS